MRSLRYTIPAAAIVLVAVVGFHWRSHSHSEAKASEGQSAVALAGMAARPNTVGVAVAASSAKRALVPGPSRAAVTVRADEVVARVNGKRLTARDVMAFEGIREQSIDPDSFAQLRERAVERELTLAEARKQGVTLGDEQQRQLAEVRKQAEMRGSPATPGSSSADEVALEVRDAETAMLQTELLARAGTPPPSPTEADVEKYYQRHSEEFDELPADPTARAAARQKIDLEIRSLLANQQQESWAKQRQALLDRLRAAASINY